MPELRLLWEVLGPFTQSGLQRQLPSTVEGNSPRISLFSLLIMAKLCIREKQLPQLANNSRDNDWHKNYVHSIHQSLSKNLNLKLLNDTTAAVAVVKSNTGNRYSLRKSASHSRRDTLAKDCSTCAPNSVLPDNSGTQIVEVPPSDGSEDSSLALVPIQTPETVVSSSNSIVIRKSPELRTGWPLLRRVFLCNKKPWEKSNVRKMPVVQWILRFPGRYSSAVVHPDQKQISSGQDEDQLFNLDGETGAIVPVGTDGAIPPPSPYNCLKSLPKELVGFHEKYSSTCRLFSYQELLLATSNFITENLVGKGGSSQVYRGCLPDCKELAVKILKPSEDVLKEFVSEVEIITTLHHKNIISLFGLCFEDNNLVLVYDFLPRGSLEENLHGNKKDEIKFGWGDRYKVALGVAEALDYLHNCSPQPVIHRDVKSSNILLSDDFEPQLSDFGLATWAATSSSHMACTDVAGTFGKPINSEHPKGQESLVMWAKPILKGGKVFQLLDPRLGSNYDHGQIERMGLAATLCIRRAHQFRPEISLVLKLLQGDMETIKWAQQQVNALEELDAMDGEAFPSDIQSHLNLALLDLEDDSLSVSSSEQSVSLEDYLQGRWSRTSSFN
ncbi:hypothetical protein L1049_019729 [Liquidambar formosana]|uniref:Protein kinase domain-containing protein n=1 Tax=Liquidambar formosana TaxID=63359 RepID=A0AAP0SA68_LIQFO